MSAAITIKVENRHYTCACNFGEKRKKKNPT